MKCLLTRFDEDTITYFTYVDKMINNLLYRSNLYLNIWIFESHIPEKENHIYHTQVKHSNPYII